LKFASYRSEWGDSMIKRSRELSIYIRIWSLAYGLRAS
jgi:hypothetical protein